MDDQELRKLLEQLHAEIERTKTVDENERELLSDLGTDIRALLARSGGDLEPPHPLTVQRLEDTLTSFEVAYPTLTTLVSKLLATLSNSGI